MVILLLWIGRESSRRRYATGIEWRAKNDFLTHFASPGWNAMQLREHVFLISDAGTEEPLLSFYVAVTRTLSALIFPSGCSSAAVPS